MEIPEKYQDLYRSITDEAVFVFQKWYKYPTNELQIEFIEWYYKSTLNIEFSETRSHFRVIDFSAPAIDKWNGRATSFNMEHPLTKARSPERLEAQRKYWKDFWDKKNGKVADEAFKIADEILDDLSIL